MLKKVLITILILVVFSASALALVGCTTGPMLWTYNVVSTYPSQEAVIEEDTVTFVVYVGVKYGDVSFKEVQQEEISKANTLIFKYLYYNEGNQAVYNELFRVQESIFTEKFICEGTSLTEKIVVSIPLGYFKEDEGCLNLEIYVANEELGLEKALTIINLKYSKTTEGINLISDEKFYTFVE